MAKDYWKPCVIVYKEKDPKTGQNKTEKGLVNILGGIVSEETMKNVNKDDVEKIIK